MAALLDKVESLLRKGLYVNANVTLYSLLIARISLELQDVKGPQTVAFNLPNDERIVNEHGTSMVLLKNVSEAKYVSFF